MHNIQTCYAMFFFFFFVMCIMCDMQYVTFCQYYLKNIVNIVHNCMIIVHCAMRNKVHRGFRTLLQFSTGYSIMDQLSQPSNPNLQCRWREQRQHKPHLSSSLWLAHGDICAQYCDGERERVNYFLK